MKCGGVTFYQIFRTHVDSLYVVCYNFILCFSFSGKSLGHVLTLLRGIDKPAYSSLAKEFRYYAACVGLVDTGYFRKRSDPAMRDNSSPTYKVQEPPLDANVEFVPDNESPASLASYRKWLENFKSALTLRPTLRSKPNYFLAALYKLNGAKS